MQFLYNQSSGEEILEICNEDYTYIIKARRHKTKDQIFLRNLKDDIKYAYTIEEIKKNKVILTLNKKTKDKEKKINKIVFAWSMIDQKIIEKTLPSLNEIGVEKLIFIYSDFSQRQFKPNLERLEKICINSCQQCGRTTLMKFEIIEKIEIFLNLYSNVAVIDFSDKNLSNFEENIESVLIGPEGGFSENERKLFENFKIFSFKTNLILRSQTAIVGVAAKLLL